MIRVGEPSCFPLAARSGVPSYESNQRLSLADQEALYLDAGVIFLNKIAPATTGLSFYTKVADNNQDYNSLFFEELKADSADRLAFTKFKEEQRTLFKRNMTVENIFNRCVMFPPDQFHAADGYFGNTLDDSRLTINFFGIAV